MLQSLFASDFIENFPLFAIILCLLCAVISFVLSGSGARRLTYVLVSVGMGLNCSVLLHNLSTGERFTYMMGHFPAPWGNEIAAGLLEPAFALLFGVVILCSIAAGKSRILLDVRADKQNFYYILVDLAQVAMFALCYTNDIFTGYVFIEICTLASCGLLMIREGGKPLVAATRYMIFNLIGSGMFLIGITLLYGVTGHLLFPQLQEAAAAAWSSGMYHGVMVVSIGLTVSGLAIKSGLFPFHFWMPDTYGTATPSSSGILSGVISKGYIFLLIKIIYRVYGHDLFMETGIQNILFLFGIAGMIIGSVSAIRARTITKMTAFSSAAQIGYIFMGIGMGTREAMIAVFFHICAHAITKPVLFLSSGALIDASDGKRDFNALHGAAHRNPEAGFAFLCGSLSMIGFPIFTGFISKLYFALSAFAFPHKSMLVLLALAVSTILNVIYFMYVSVILYSGKADPARRVGFRQQRTFTVAVFVLILVNVAIGLHSQPLTSLFEAGLDLFLG